MVSQITDVVKTKATHVDYVDMPPLSLAARIPIASTKRAYTGIADYFGAYGLTVADAERWRWKQVKQVVLDHCTINRPAFKLETVNGPRWRFSDAKGGYIHNLGYKPCFYGDSAEVKEFVNDGNPLVICNGERSTVVAQTRLVPAICITSGEKRIPDNLMLELKQWLEPGAEIILANDCDPAGRKATAAQRSQLIEAGYKVRAVDLGLSDGGDLADFVVLGPDAYKRLLECPELPEIEAPLWKPHVNDKPYIKKPANLSPDAEAKRENWLKKTWDGIVRTVETTTRERYAVSWWGGCKLLDLVEAGYRSESEARSAIENACEVNGYRAEHGHRAVMAQWQGAVKATREPVDMPDFSASLEQTFRAYIDQNKPSSDITPILEASDGRPEQLPDTLPRAMIEIGLKVWGVQIVAEIAYLLYAIAHKRLPSFFTMRDRNEASDTPADKNIFTEMLDMNILFEVSSELISQMPHISKDTWGKQRINSPGRKEKVYRLATLAELKKAIFKPLARSLALDSVESDQLPLINEGVKPLVRYVLEKLVAWNAPLKKVNIGIVRYCLKKADKHRDAEVLEAIRVLRMTDAAFLGAMKLEAAQTAAAAYFSHADEETAALIELKNRLLTIQYQAYTKSLANPVITPLPEGVPSTAQAWQNAHNNALLKPHNGGYLWPHELCEVMGIEDKKTAKRTAARAGVTIGETRFEVRAFTVEAKHDYKPSWDDIVTAGKKALEHRDKALEGRVRVWGPVQMHSVIRSYDDTGRLVAQGYVSEADEPDDWRIGGTRFTIECELRPLITVSDVAPLAATIEADEPEESAGMTPDEMLIDESLDDEAIRQIAAFIALARHLHRAGRRRRRRESQRNESNRITPARLHNDDWMLRRVLASYCFIGVHGMWCNPLNVEEVFETHHAAVDDLVSIVKPSEEVAQERAS